MECWERQNVIAVSVSSLCSVPPTLYVLHSILSLLQLLLLSSHTVLYVYSTCQCVLELVIGYMNTRISENQNYMSCMYMYIVQTACTCTVGICVHVPCTCTCMRMFCCYLSLTSAKAHDVGQKVIGVSDETRSCTNLLIHLPVCHKVLYIRYNNNKYSDT